MITIMMGGVVEMAETDATGSIHNTTALRWAERAESALFRAVGAPPSIGLPRVRVEAEFHAPLRFQDEYEFALHVTRMGRTSLSYQYEARCGDRVCLSGSTTLVHIVDGRPAPVPEELRSLLSADRIVDERQGGTTMIGKLAHLSEIRRYPVKSLQGERLAQSTVTSAGLPWDRAFGITNDRFDLNPFGTWTTYEAFHGLAIRSDLGGYTAEVHSGTGRRELVLTSPDGARTAVEVTAEAKLKDSEDTLRIVAEWFGTPTSTARLVASGSHLWDVEYAAISIINLATVRELSRVAGQDIDARRFRGNLFLDGLDPWAELSLAGRRISIGMVELEVLEPIQRCRATAVNPDLPTADINVPGLLMSRFGHIHCGLYARVVVPGIVHEGDPLTVHPGRELPQVLAGVPEDEKPGTPRSARVTASRRATTTTTSIEFDDSAGLLEAARAGQYVRVHRTATDTPSWRNYTLSKTGEGGSRITVEALAGADMSAWISSVRVGSEILISGPFGEATAAAESTAPLAVITAGIGITPALAVADALSRAADPRPLSFVHVARSEEQIPHLDQLRHDVDLLPQGRLCLFLTGDGPLPAGARAGRPTKVDLKEIFAADGTDVLLCGPPAFIQAMHAAAVDAGVDAERIRWDAFYSPPTGSLETRRPPAAGPFAVTFDRSAAVLEWTESAGTLLDLGEAAGISLRSGCRAGACGSCARPVQGDVAYLLEPSVTPATGTALLCCAVPISSLQIKN